MIDSNAALEEFQKSNKPQINDMDKRIYAAQEPLYVFSVSPQPIDLDLSFTKVFIGTANDDTGVSVPFEIKGMYHDYAQGTGDKFTLEARPVLGSEVVADIFAQHDLAARGCFSSRSKVATSAEIFKAREALRPKMLELVAEGNRFYAGGPQQQASISHPHREAARWLNIDVPWANSVTEMERCGACGNPNMKGLAVCPNCTAVLDEAKARKFFPERFAGKKAA